MRSKGSLEPGLLPTFRLFMGAEFVVATLGFALHMLPPVASSLQIVQHLNTLAVSTGILRQLAFLAFAAGPLYLYLSLPRLQTAMGRFYLPVAIAWAAAAPILSPYVHGEGSADQNLFMQAALWQQIILLFIPLIVTSWQYEIRSIAMFCAAVLGLNLLLMISGLVPLQPALLRSLVGILVVEFVALQLVGHMIANLVRVQREQRRGLAEANQRLAQYASTLEQLTISRERNRLGRELHDVLAHTLSGVAVELEGLRATLRHDPDRANALLDHSLQAIREGLTETRRALQELRARPLEELGLALAVRALAESYASRAGLRADIRIEGEMDDVGEDVQQSAYRIAEEALANVANHAQAQNLQVLLKNGKGRLELTIHDDGCGFDPAQPGAADHYGLLGMRERAQLVGGQLCVESKPREGTTICFVCGGRA